MKKIDLTIMVSSLPIGGAEQVLLELLKNIDREHFSVRVFFLRSPGPMGAEILQLGFPVQTDIISCRFDPMGVFKLARVLSAEQTDVLLLINHLNTLFYGVLAAKMVRVPVCINWQHETFRKYPLHKLTMLGRRILHMGIDCVVAVACGHKDYIARVEKITPRKITAIYNGVNPLRFRSALSPSEAKKRLGVPQAGQAVGILAALRPDKAHDVFLRAAQIVLKYLPETQFLIVGDGPQRPSLTRMTHDLRIEGNVHFLGFQRELADIFAAVDVNVLSSNPEQETFSVAVIEAMSAGVPVVCTDVGFMNEIVIPGKTGYLVKVGDYEEIADKLIFLLENELLRTSMREETQKLVREKLSVGQMTRAFENLFMKIYTSKTS